MHRDVHENGKLDVLFCTGYYTGGKKNAAFLCTGTDSNNNSENHHSKVEFGNSIEKYSQITVHGPSYKIMHK